MQLRKFIPVLARFSPALAIVVPVLLLSIGNAPNWSATVVAANNPRLRHGEEIFQQKCIGCHNKQPEDSTPFGPPNLRNSFRGDSRLTRKEAFDIIANGKGTMPGWGKVLTPSDINDVVAYLKTR